MKRKQQFLHGLSGRLTPHASKLVNDNGPLLDKLLHSRKLSGLGNTTSTVRSESKKMSFDEVFKLYNAGISEDDVKAWVWYKRSIGMPMTGWEKFYLKAQVGDLQMVKTTRSITIKDNHFRDIQSVEPNQVLGKYIKSHFLNEDSEYYIFRGKDGLYYVYAGACKLEKVASSGLKSDMDRMVEGGSLFYHNGELLPFPIFAFGNIYDQKEQLLVRRHLKEARTLGS